MHPHLTFVHFDEYVNLQSKPTKAEAVPITNVKIASDIIYNKLDNIILEDTGQGIYTYPLTV